MKKRTRRPKGIKPAELVALAAQQGISLTFEQAQAAIVANHRKATRRSLIPSAHGRFAERMGAIGGGGAVFNGFYQTGLVLPPAKKRGKG